MNTSRSLGVIALGVLAVALGAVSVSAQSDQARSAPWPEHLRDTGLYLPGSTTEIDPANLAFSPQYPLWSDGATKRRWIRLPHGSAIDATHPDAWEFPPGTRLWKEFSFGRAVETRVIDRLGDGSWRFASYVWNAEGSDATLVPAEGIAKHPVADAPGGYYVIPSEADCRACHEGAMAPVLGFSALQLSPDRDASAPHAVSAGERPLDLKSLVDDGLLRNLPKTLLEQPPRVAADTPTARAALGYLHANCGQCHHRGANAVPVALTLAQEVGQGAASSDAILRSAIAAPGRYRAAGSDATLLIAPGNPDQSLLALRMRSHNPYMRMPPLGTRTIDTEALALVERWITAMNPKEEGTP